MVGVNILEFGADICNHHEKCIHISTNMPSIGLVIVKNRHCINKIDNIRLHGETNGRGLSV